MEINSIEQIWREGDFSTNPERSISFRSIKSIHFIDEFKSTYRRNLIGLMATALIVMLAFTFGGVPIEGLILFVMLSLLTIFGYRRLKGLKDLKKEEATQDYILAFYCWLNNMLKDFQLIYRFVYPLLFLTFVSAFFRTSLFSMLFGETLWDKVVSGSSTYLINGIPVIYISIFLVVAILISIFSQRLFKADINSVYGQMMMHLDTLLSEFKNE